MLKHKKFSSFSNGLHSNAHKSLNGKAFALKEQEKSNEKKAKDESERRSCAMLRINVSAINHNFFFSLSVSKQARVVAVESIKCEHKKIKCEKADFNRRSLVIVSLEKMPYS